MVGLEFILSGVRKELGCVEINMAMEIMNYLGGLAGTVVRHDSNNND